MTTNVPKGAGRSTATAKRNKHAQNTPLPPKAGSPGAEAIAERQAEIAEKNRSIGQTRYGMMKVVELRKVASELLVPGARSMAKGDLLNAILEAERAKAKTDERLAGRDLAAEVFQTAEKSKPAAAPPVSKPKAKAKGADVPECSGNINITEAQEKSIAKAEAFLEAAAALGWAEKARSSMEQDSYGVIVGRGEERIAISWRSGVFVGEECYHSHPARSPRKVINASAAKKIMGVSAAQADEEAQKVSANKAARPRRDRGSTATTATRKALPFSEASLDQEVLDALYGRTITWTNSISGEAEEARVPALAENTRNDDGTPGKLKQSHAPRITEGKSGRQIEFVSASGYRTVRLASILAVR